MRHFVRVQLTSLVTLCVSLVLTSALLTCVLTLMFASPIAEVTRSLHLTVSRDPRLYARGIPPLFEGGQAIDTSVKESTQVLLRHPKKNDLDPQTPTWMQPSLSANKEESKLEQPQSRAPQCILLGFAKCGTSALLEFLNLHSKIVSLDWEPDYFCDRMYKKYDLRWYVGRMPPSLPGQITIEKSPCYIVEHDAHLRIHAMNSSIKLMVLVRDPVTRLISEQAHYTSYYSYWGLSSVPFENRFYNNETGRFKEDMILKGGNYAPHFEHLLKVFPREQILIVDGDKLITNPLSQLSRIETFLGLQHEISRDDIYFDREKGFYCMNFRDAGNKKCMGKSKGREHEQVSEQFKQKLAAFLKPYNENFFKLVGERFNWR